MQRLIILLQFVLCCSKNKCTYKHLIQTPDIQHCKYNYVLIFYLLCLSSLNGWASSYLTEIAEINYSPPICVVSKKPASFFITTSWDPHFCLSHYFSLTMAVPFIFLFFWCCIINTCLSFYFVLLLISFIIYIYLFIINTVLNVHHHRSVLEWSNSSIPSTSK